MMVVASLTRESILLDDIAKVDKMIELHSSGDSNFMRDQYISKRNELIKKLDHERSKIARKLDYVAIKKVTMTVTAINHKLRQQILKLLEAKSQMNVTEIYVSLGIEPAVISQHLAILRRADIVLTKRDGKSILYALNRPFIATIAHHIGQLAYSG